LFGTNRGGATDRALGDDFGSNYKPPSIPKSDANAEKNMRSDTHKLHEQRVRRLARKHHCRIIKRRERVRVPRPDNYGEYMLLNENNWVLLGSRLDATLDDIENFFRRAARDGQRATQH
jgi:hypothetical protein